MAYEDFTTYVEGADSGNALSQTASRASWTDLQNNHDAYLYKDFGVDHFDGDFEFLFEAYVSPWDSDAATHCCLLANNLGNYGEFVNNNWSMLDVWLYSFVPGINGVFIQELDEGNIYNDVIVGGIDAGTLYYFTFERDESVGSFGTIYVYVRTGSHDGPIVTTLSVELHTSKRDFRYLETTISHGETATSKSSGYVQNLDLQESDVGIDVTQIGRGFSRGVLRGVNRGVV